MDVYNRFVCHPCAYVYNMYSNDLSLFTYRFNDKYPFDFVAVLHHESAVPGNIDMLMYFSCLSYTIDVISYSIPVYGGMVIGGPIPE